MRRREFCAAVIAPAVAAAVPGSERVIRTFPSGPLEGLGDLPRVFVGTTPVVECWISSLDDELFPLDDKPLPGLKSVGPITLTGAWR